MRAGTLRHRISIQREQRVADGYGGFTITWPEVRKEWARVAPVRGEESLVHRQLQDRITHKVTLRYHPSIVSAQRIAWEGRVFQIREVLNVEERNIMLELRCEEGVAQ